MENAIIGMGGLSLISQYIDVITGNKYAPTSTNNENDINL